SFSPSPTHYRPSKSSNVKRFAGWLALLNVNAVFCNKRSVSMRSLKSLFNSVSTFLDNQERVDKLATGAAGVMAGAGAAHLIGFMTVNPMLMIVGLVTFVATPVLSLP